MKKKTLIRLIIIMLICVAAAIGSLLYRGTELTNAREQRESIVASEKVIEAADTVSSAAAEVVSRPYFDPATYAASEHVYSHRGSAGSREHTFEAYDAAIEAGSHYIELDLVRSADGTLYISHDQTPERLTGGGRAFAAMTDAEIDELRTANGEKIHTLSEVFDRYGTAVNYVIEFKNYNQETIEAFEKLVDQYGYADNIIAQCFELASLEALDAKYPDMPMLFLIDRQSEVSLGIDKSYIDIIAVDKDLMTRKNCEFAHNYGKKFSVWTLDTEDEIREAISIGADTFFTNDTPLAIKLLKENQ